MANKVLSIDIGYSLTKVCEMDYQAKLPKIYHSFTLATPEGMLNDGVVSIDDTFIAEFKALLFTYKIKTKKIIFSIASSKIATREAKVPFCKPNRIADVVRVNLEDYFPIDASKYLISHSILGTEDSAAKNDVQNQSELAGGRPTGYKLLLFAAPKPLMHSYEELAKAMDMELVTIDHSGNSVYRAVKDDCSEGTQLVIKIDERSSLLMVLKNGVIVLNRGIPYGIDEMLDGLMKTKGLGDVTTYEKARRLAVTRKCLVERLEDIREVQPIPSEEEQAPSDIEDIDTLEEQEQVTRNLQTMLNGIARVIDYYNSNHTQEPIEKMHLTGIGSDIVGLDVLLANELAVSIENLTELSSVNVAKHFENTGFGEYITCIGAVLSPLTFYSDKPEEKRTRGRLGIPYEKVAAGVLAAGIVAGIVVIVTAIVPYIQEKQKKAEYEEIITQLQPVYDTYVQYQQLNSEWNQLQTLDWMTKNQNEGMVALIETLEQNMPSSFRLNSLNASTDGVVLDVTVSAKEEAAVVLSELKKLSMFTQTDTASVTEVTTEIGEVQYNFTVNLIYAPVMPQEEEQP